MDHMIMTHSVPMLVRLSVLALGTTIVAAQEATEPIDALLAKRCLDEAAALSQADGGALWGRPLYGPMLFIDPATRRIVSSQRDTAGTLTFQESAGVWVGTLPEEFHIANTAFDWG